MVVRNLGIDGDEVREMFKKTNGCHIKYHVLQATYVRNKEIVVLRDMCIKAFLLFLVCCTIFSNKSTNYVDVVYLRYFEDLTEVHKWN
jgi:hypothetical protein